MSSLSSWLPHRKVAVAGLSGPAITALLVWLLPSLPGPVVAALSAILTALIAYWVPGPSGTAEQPAIANVGPPHVDPLTHADL